MTYTQCITAVLIKKASALLANNNQVATQPDSSKSVVPFIPNNKDPINGAAKPDAFFGENPGQPFAANAAMKPPMFADNKPLAPGALPSQQTPQISGAKETPKSTGKLQGLAGN